MQLKAMYRNKSRYINIDVVLMYIYLKKSANYAV